MSGYTLHPQALADLEEIWDFIATGNPAAADRVLEEIYETIQSLVKMPHRGHRRPDLTSGPFRFCAVRSYLIAYTPDKSPISVIAILHGRRNPRVMQLFSGDVNEFFKWFSSRTYTGENHSSHHTLPRLSF